ncbi:MAG TPA: hypothetical protein VNY24_02895 [Candidatus Acidoferrales bacterium]|nr:hypothetical protein [Candidatus Acidoferrales bacterium]
MRNRRLRTRKLRGQEGYALALVVFMLALAVIATATLAPDVITNGRREKEEEMIWRGKQYVRGIRLYVRYYQMHGGTTRFPTSMEDLTKNKVGIRFMRQAYKDPVNPVDGSWRMIYVGPNGQLIGSLKSRPLTPGGQNSSFGSGSSSGFGSSFGGSQSSSGNNSSFGSSSFGSSSFGNSSFNNGGSANTTNPQGQAAGQGAAGNLSSESFSAPQPIANSDGTTEVLGGNIIGVGSKVNKASIIWYDKAKNYRQFEFIWDPAKEPINGGATAVIGAPPAGTQNGSNSIFGNPGGTSGFGQQPTGSPTGSPAGNPNPGTGNNPPPGQTPPGQTPQ